MSREIKFRLRDRDNKAVGYEKWYCGTWHPPHPQNGAGIADGYWTARPLWLYSIDGKRWTPTYIRHTYKEQYTGREDKNGVGIWESDLVKPPHDREWVYEVYWDDRDSSWRLRIHGEMQYDKTTALMFAERGEVIGNICENPELAAQ